MISPECPVFLCRLTHPFYSNEVVRGHWELWLQFAFFFFSKSKFQFEICGTAETKKKKTRFRWGCLYFFQFSVCIHQPIMESLLVPPATLMQPPMNSSMSFYTQSSWLCSPAEWSCLHGDSVSRWATFSSRDDLISLSTGCQKVASVRWHLLQTSKGWFCLFCGGGLHRKLLTVTILPRRE